MYKKAPQITKDRYFIETMDEIFSKTPNKVIVDTRLENFLPMLNLKNKEEK
jgi:membrane protease subunit HflK